MQVHKAAFTEEEWETILRALRTEAKLCKEVAYHQLGGVKKSLLIRAKSAWELFKELSGSPF